MSATVTQMATNAKNRSDASATHESVVEGSERKNPATVSTLQNPADTMVVRRPATQSDSSTTAT